MSEKNSSQTSIHGLVIFKHEGGLKKKKRDNFLVEKINKEYKIKITNSLTTQGTHYRYSILINNENSASIANINIKVTYPEFLKYTGSYPLTLITSSSIVNEQGKKNIINLNLKGLKGKSSEQILLHFTPSTQLDLGEFKTFLKYKNNKGKEREIKSHSINIQIDDINIIPKIISHSRIREFSQIPGIKRALVSFGFGTSKKLNLKKIFDILVNLILSYNFQIIIKDKEKSIIWFCGSELTSSNDLLILSKIGTNIIEIIAYSINPIILGLFLSSFTKNLKEQLLMNKIIKSNIKVFELECVNCGENLHYFPKKGESITCLKCSYKQNIW
ncbi:MAG: hypothetical protein ACFFG0_31325 [Candidatus Thorarchaeota archaeon]